MGKNRIRKTTKDVTLPTPFDEARDELFQHIMRCGVIGSDPEHQTDWFNDTMQYVSDRYHELTERELTDLRVLGERFVQPPKASAQTASAVTAA
jgi:hypothetical protein